MSLALLFQQVVGKRIFAIDQIGTWTDLFVGKAANGFAQKIDFFIDERETGACAFSKSRCTNDSGEPGAIWRNAGCYPVDLDESAAWIESKSDDERSPR